MIHIKCLFFAASKDIVGNRQVMMECAEATTLAAFQKQLLDSYPDLKGL